LSDKRGKFNGKRSSEESGKAGTIRARRVDCKEHQGGATGWTFKEGVFMAGLAAAAMDASKT
jgi:hypothetical protein